MSKYKMWRVFLSVVFVCSNLTWAAGKAKKPELKPFPEITNLKELVTALKLESFKAMPATRKIKIAVLGNGFFSHDFQIGKTLPSDVKYDAGPFTDADEDIAASTDFHDLMLAKVVTDLIKASGFKGEYELHLIQATGLDKFEAALKRVKDEQFDLVLYSQVWQWAGNGDGKGYANTMVNEAISKGTIWINASGDYGKTLTRIAPIKTDGTNWVQFTDSSGNTQDYVKVICKVPKGNKCRMNLMVAWNDFKDVRNVGTDKDLDIYFLNSKQKLIASSRRIQLLKRDTSNDFNTIYPREEFDIPRGKPKKPNYIPPADPGTYYLKVELKSKNFDPEKDKLRIMITGQGFELDAPTPDETLLPPADNDSVISVGASDDDFTSRSVSRGIPQIYLKSATKHKDGSFFFSSSNAAALAATVAALHLMTGTEQKRDVILAKLKEISRNPDQDVVKVEGSVEVAPKPRRHLGPDLQRTQPRTQRPYNSRDEDNYYEPMDDMWNDDISYDDMGDGMMGPAPVGGAVGAVVAPPPVVVRPPVPMAPLPVMYEYAVYVLQNGGRAGRDRFGRPVIFIDLAQGDALGLVTRVPCQRGFVTPQGSQFFYQNQLGGGLPPTYYEVVPVPQPLPPGSCGGW